MITLFKKPPEPETPAQRRARILLNVGALVAGISGLWGIFHYAR